MHIFVIYEMCADHRAMEGTCTRRQSVYHFICLYLLAYNTNVAS